jgi:hypothetical protein
MSTKTIPRSTNNILFIAHSFPLLKEKLQGFHPNEFKPEQLVKISRGWSTSEILLRNFVLTAWCRLWAKDNGCLFDVFEALGTFDGTNREILLKWLNDPKFPGGYL